MKIRWTIQDSLTALINRNPSIKQTGIFRDEHGIYAFSCMAKGNVFYFCTKQSMAGNVVSCHKKLIEQARMYKRWILMGIGSHYYWFRTEDIEGDPRTFMNERNGVPMVNFYLDIGRRLGEKPKLSQQEGELFQKQTQGAAA